MKSTQKFETVVDSELLGKTLSIAQAEGRNFELVLEEALRDLIEKKSSKGLDQEFLKHYEATVEEFHTVFERLAK
jgi:hypothetical protein